jgi:hypothetical protein
LLVFAHLPNKRIGKTSLRFVLFSGALKTRARIRCLFERFYPNLQSRLNAEFKPQAAFVLSVSFARRRFALAYSSGRLQTCV